MADYEYLRHVAAAPGSPNWKQLQKDSEVALELYLRPEIGRILLANGFPKEPFYRLSKKTQRQIKFWFSHDMSPAIRCEDIRVLHRLGVFTQLAEQAEAIAAAGGYVPAEIQCGPDWGVVCFSFFSDCEPEAARRVFDQWLEVNAHRFKKAGRAGAGRRAKDNPLYRIKDLAAARLLALHDFDHTAMNNWTARNQPRDKDGKHFAWFGNKARNSRGPLIQVPREGRLLLARFEKTLHNFCVRIEAIANAAISVRSGLQRRPSSVHN